MVAERVARVVSEPVKKVRWDPERGQGITYQRW